MEDVPEKFDCRMISVVLGFILGVLERQQHSLLVKMVTILDYH